MDLYRVGCVEIGIGGSDSQDMSNGRCLGWCEGGVAGRHAKSNGRVLGRRQC